MSVSRFWRSLYVPGENSLSDIPRSFSAQGLVKTRVPSGLMTVIPDGLVSRIRSRKRRSRRKLPSADRLRSRARWKKAIRKANAVAKASTAATRYPQATSSGLGRTKG